MIDLKWGVQAGNHGLKSVQLSKLDNIYTSHLVMDGGGMYLRFTTEQEADQWISNIKAAIHVPTK